MKEKSGIQKALRTTGYVISCLVFAILLVIAISVLIKTCKLETSSRARMNLHYYLVAGFVAFFAVFLIPRLRNNFRWLMKFTHEFTHHAITLSPYCVPLFTLVLLPWRFTTGTATPLFLAAIDAIIGFTYAFHICCWVKQTRLHQTDISGPGVILSLLIIATVHILNFCLVVLTPSSGVVLAIQRVFWDFPSSFVMSIVR